MLGLFIWCKLASLLLAMSISLAPEYIFKAPSATFGNGLCKHAIIYLFIFMLLIIISKIKLIDPFRIRHATSVPLGKGTKFALRHGKLLTTKPRAIQFLHISMFQFTFKCGYNYFIFKYTDINSLHVTQIDLLHSDTFCST